MTEMEDECGGARSEVRTGWRERARLRAVPLPSFAARWAHGRRIRGRHSCTAGHVHVGTSQGERVTAVQVRPADRHYARNVTGIRPRADGPAPIRPTQHRSEVRHHRTEGADLAAERLLRATRSLTTSALRPRPRTPIGQPSGEQAQHGVLEQRHKRRSLESPVSSKTWRFRSILKH